MFRWDTIEEVGRFDLRYRDGTVPGTMLEVELLSGEKVRVWRAEDGREYFCHGLTFGGAQAPGGAVSPLGDHVPTILRACYDVIAEGEAKAGDVLVWYGADADDVIHSAVLTDPVVAPGGKNLDYAARLRTKNGVLPEANWALGALVESLYGEWYVVYRRR